MSRVNQGWKEAWTAKEDALKARMAKQVERLQANAHVLKPLQVGDIVRIQNQTGSHPNKWDKTGTVVQVGQNDQYIVKVDGSWCLTLRNRKFLRKMIPRGLEDQENKLASPSSLPASNLLPSLPVPMITDANKEPSKGGLSDAVTIPEDPSPLNNPVREPLSVTPSALPKTKETVVAPPDVPHSQAIKLADTSPMQMRPKRDRKKPDWYGDRV